MRCGWRNNLRSRSICSSFSGALAFLAEVSARGIRASAAVAAFVVAMGVAMALDVLHGLVVVASAGLLIVIVAAATHGRKFPVDVHLFAL